VSGPLTAFLTTRNVSLSRAAPEKKKPLVTSVANRAGSWLNKPTAGYSFFSPVLVDFHFDFLSDEIKGMLCAPDGNMHITFNNGSLGSCIDEGRSEMR
jgi:hypothetical protein